jgi:DNA-nicking Smr family endonuclease
MEGASETQEHDAVAISEGLSMPRFTILSNDGSYLSAEFTAPDAGSVLQIAEKIGCHEADILKDGQYSLSIRLDVHGVCSIFQREQVAKARAFLAQASETTNLGYEWHLETEGG